MGAMATMQFEVADLKLRALLFSPNCRSIVIELTAPIL